MSKVFFGGSRKIRRLSQTAMDRTDNIMANGYLILLGDANGADKAMQGYLAGKNYRNVLVFCMGNDCRNNLGKWETRKVYSDRTRKDFYYYSTKDVLMSDEADYGFMLWDGKSKGTLNNVLNLSKRNKSALVYFSPTKSFYTIKDRQDVAKLLELCDPISLKKFDQILKIDCHVQPKQHQLDFA